MSELLTMLYQLQLLSVEWIYYYELQMLSKDAIVVCFNALLFSEKYQVPIHFLLAEIRNE